MRNWLLFLLLTVMVIVPFLIWGEWFTQFFAAEHTIIWLEAYGNWAWGVAIALLMADLFLPLPGTVIMSALGYLYGPVLGGLLAITGNVLSGLLAYGLCRQFGEGAAQRLLGEQDYAKGQKTFANQGGWIVAISRWLPILPEVVACMAGINRMPFVPFLVALMCGAMPLGFVFAYIGHQGVEYPYLAITVSAVLPALLWLVAQYLLRQKLATSGDLPDDFQ